MSRACCTGFQGQVRLSPGSAHLHADASLELELQPDHVHLFHGAELVKLRDFLGHLINRHFDRVQFCARLAYDLDSLLHVGKQVTGCRGTAKRTERRRVSADSGSPEGADSPGGVSSAHSTFPPASPSACELSFALCALRRPSWELLPQLPCPPFS